MRKLIIFFAALVLLSCSRKVVTVERVTRDTVTVERVAQVVEVAHDTVTIERVIEAEQQRVELDTAGRVRVVVKTVYRDNGKTSAGSVIERVVHDTVTVQAGHSEKERTTTPQTRKNNAPYVVIISALLALVVAFLWVRRAAKI